MSKENGGTGDDLKFNIGDTINGFTLVHKIDEGGFGQVFKVTDIRNKTFAMKIESNSQSGGSAIKLELDVLRDLMGELVFPEFIIGGKRRRYHYLVLELLGDNLRALKSQSEGDVFTSATWSRVGIQCLYAVKVLHNKGFLHRDIKPSNFAVAQNSTGGPSRRIVLFDFGLARRYIKRIDDMDAGREREELDPETVRANAQKGVDMMYERLEKVKKDKAETAKEDQEKREKQRAKREAEAKIIAAKERSAYERMHKLPDIDQKKPKEEKGPVNFDKGYRGKKEKKNRGASRERFLRETYLSKEVFRAASGTPEKVDEERKGRERRKEMNMLYKYRLARPRTDFRGTYQYASPNAHRLQELGRHDDIWSLLYMIVDLFRQLPWAAEEDVLATKTTSPLPSLFVDPCQPQRLTDEMKQALVKIQETLEKCNYYTNPNYCIVNYFLVSVMEKEKVGWQDPYDWEKAKYSPDQLKSLKNKSQENRPWENATDFFNEDTWRDIATPLDTPSRELVEVDGKSGLSREGVDVEKKKKKKKKKMTTGLSKETADENKKSPLIRKSVVNDSKKQRAMNPSKESIIPLDPKTPRSGVTPSKITSKEDPKTPRSGVTPSKITSKEDPKTPRSGVTPSKITSKEDPRTPRSGVTPSKITSKEDPKTPRSGVTPSKITSKEDPRTPRSGVTQSKITSKEDPMTPRSVVTPSKITSKEDPRTPRSGVPRSKITSKYGTSSKEDPMADDKQSPISGRTVPADVPEKKTSAEGEKM